MSRAVAQRQLKTKTRLAAGFGALGFVILLALVMMPWQTFPDLRLWIPFALAFVYFEWNSVEVNDRLFASPSIMVLLTAAVIFGPESAVIGVPHPDFGETVVGILVPDGDTEPDLTAIKENIGASLARFKLPQRLIVLPELPRNTMGKVQKKELRERFADLFST